MSTRCPPNQSTATLEALSTNITVGNISAINLPARTEVSVRSLLALANRVVSMGSRTNARTTRTPAICSRSTRFTTSIRACMARNCGIIRQTMRPIAMISTGTLTSSSQASPMSVRNAMITPPMHMIGAATSSVQVISTSICTCVTSLVLRVISVGAPKWATSRSENVPDPVEQRRAHVTTESHRGARPEVDGDDRADDLQDGDGEHHHAGRHDVTGVALGHPVVDDVGVQGRQVERRDRPDELEDDHCGEWSAVGAQVLAQQGQQHYGAPTGWA